MSLKMKLQEENAQIFSRIVKLMRQIVIFVN